VDPIISQICPPRRLVAQGGEASYRPSSVASHVALVARGWSRRQFSVTSGVQPTNPAPSATRAPAPAPSVSGRLPPDHSDTGKLQKPRPHRLSVLPEGRSSLPARSIAVPARSQTADMGFADE